MRESRVFQAINKERLLFGVDPRIVGALGLLAFVILAILKKSHPFLAIVMPLGFFSVGITLVRPFQKKDPRIWSLVVESRGYKTRYDPLKVTRTRIIVC